VALACAGYDDQFAYAQEFARCMGANMSGALRLRWLWRPTER
jgi:hypothetical protein